MSAISRGYLVPSRDAVTTGPWSVSLNGQPEVDAVDAVPDWDYFSSLRVERQIHLDPDAIRRQSGLADQDLISGVVIWQSTWTGLRGSSPPVDVIGPSATVELELDGAQLGGELVLETRVITFPGPGSRPKIVAHRPGSILWTHTDRLALEGTGSRFPLLPTDFTQSGFARGRDGLWSLFVESSDLSASALGVMRLYVNSSHPRIAAMLASDPEADTRQLRAFMRYDVARQLLAVALHHDELVLDDSYPDASLGAVLVRLVRLFHRPLDELQIQNRNAPGDLESEFQALTGYLD